MIVLFYYLPDILHDDLFDVLVYWIDGNAFIK